MTTIDYYFITLSPFTYLIGDRLEQIADSHGCTIDYKPIALPKVFEATGGLPLGQRHPSRQAYRLQDLNRISKRTGLPINKQPAHWPTNPAPSCFAIIAAQKAGGGDVGLLTRLLLAACWVDEKDIAQDDVVRDCLSRAGFDPKLADSGLLSGAETFERNTDEAIARGVFGAPTFCVDDQIFWGQDRLDYLDDYLAGRAA